jgi:hypothetical protein
MGLTFVDLQLLASARREGAAFRRVATLGRQSLYLHGGELRRLRAAIADEGLVGAYRWGDPCEPILLRLMGAEEIVSIDASGYEGATLVHDLNEPLAGQEGRFDLVIDGGTLEHVLHFPVAVASAMRMVRVGGAVLTCSPANNLCGHGFYQFSPELLFRVFSAENGFRVSRMLLTEHAHPSVELAPPRHLALVKDPAEVGRRALITAGRPLMLRTLAVRTGPVPAGALRAQQSDYAARWRGEAPPDERGGAARRAALALYRRLPATFRRRIAERLAGSHVRNERFFVPLRLEDL